jgi:CubicO group peptidase (beta-lactamase class C family)
MSMRQVGALVFGLVFVLIAVAAMAADCQEPTDFHDGWTVAAPEQEGLDPALICGIGPRLEALKEANAHGVVVTRHRRLVYEHYLAGNDERLGMSLGEVNFTTRTKHDIRSISKSVTSLLVGIALDRGLLTDLDAPVLGLLDRRRCAPPSRFQNLAELAIATARILGAASTAAASLATSVPSNKCGFCVPRSRTALVKVKSRKLASVISPSSTSSQASGSGSRMSITSKCPISEL